MTAGTEVPISAAVERFRAAQRRRKSAGAQDQAAARELQDARRDLDASARALVAAAPIAITTVATRYAHPLQPGLLHVRVDQDAAFGPRVHRRKGDIICHAGEAGAATAIGGQLVPCPSCMERLQRLVERAGE